MKLVADNRGLSGFSQIGGNLFFPNYPRSSAKSVFFRV